VRHNTAATGCLLAILSAGACGGNPPLTCTKDLRIDACALLPPSEISAVIDLPVDAGRREDSGIEANGSYSSACVWLIKLEDRVADPSAPLNGQSFVILNAMQWPAGSDLARTFLDAFRLAASKGEIPGKPSSREFGDEALWWGDGLAVRKGDVSFGISVFIPGLTPKSSGAFESQLAPQILRHIEQREKQKCR
jgi:hypothetical protein